MDDQDVTVDTSAGPRRPEIRSRVTPWMVFTVLAIAWVIFIAFTTPNFGGGDAFVFRDAGCNCAAGHGLVSDSVPTDGVLIPPRIFAAYTPGTPLLFAPAARLFGCNSYTDTYYNFFLLVLGSIFTLWLYLGFEDRPGWRLGAALLLGMTLPGGLFLTDLDRPEAIGLTIALPLLLLWRRSKGSLVKSLLLGCCGVLFLVHPFLGIVEFLLFLLLLLWTPSKQGRLKTALTGLLLTTLTVILFALYWQRHDPTVIQRFLSHAAIGAARDGVLVKGGSNTASHVGRLHNYAAAARGYFSTANVLSGAPLFALLCSFGALFFILVRSRSKGGNRNALLQLGCLFGILFIFPATFFLFQRNYFAAASAILFAAITIGGYNLSDRLKRTGAPMYVLLIVAFFSLPIFSLHLIAACESRASYLRASEQAARVKQIFEAQGEPQPRILVDPLHFFLYKPYFRYLYNWEYLRPDESTAGFQGLVRCYTGELAFRRSELGWKPPFDRNNWKLIDGDQAVERITLFGHVIQRRNWTWACDVYERRDAEP